MAIALLVVCLLLVVALMREMTRSEAAESRADTAEFIAAGLRRALAESRGGPIT